MRKIVVLLLVFVSLVLVVGAVVADPVKGPATALVEDCKWGAELGYFSSVGSCVARYRAYASYPAKYCQDFWYFDEFNLASFGVTFENEGQCVNFLVAYFQAG